MPVPRRRPRHRDPLHPRAPPRGALVRPGAGTPPGRHQKTAPVFHRPPRCPLPRRDTRVGPHRRPREDGPRQSEKEPHMSPRKESRNIAARMGRWSAAHRKTAIIGWLAFVIVAFSLTIFSPMTTIEDADRGVGESGRADKIIDRAFDLDEDGLGEFVVVQSDTLTADYPEFRAHGGRRRRHRRLVRRGAKIQSPFAPANAGPDLPRPPRGHGRVRPPRRLRRGVAYIDDIVAAVDEVQDGAPRPGRRRGRRLDRQGAPGPLQLPARAGRPHRHPAHASVILLLVMGTGLGAAGPRASSA